MDSGLLGHLSRCHVMHERCLSLYQRYTPYLTTESKEKVSFFKPLANNGLSQRAKFSRVGDNLQVSHLGIDIGGTFTDFALLDLDTGDLYTHKVLTSADDPVRSVLKGIRELLDQQKSIVPERVVHGTTLVTNAVVERKGASTALLTTRGFRDVLEIRREGRYDLYDLNLEFPEPLAPRHQRFEVDERMDENGRVRKPLDETSLETLLFGLHDLGIESWAVCFLHAYADGSHESRVGELLKEQFPGIPVSLSSEVAPEIREYERTSTTVANAYVRPIAEGYLNRLTEGLSRELGQTKPVVHIMLSDGGITTPEIAAAHPIRIVESGPAGGVQAAARLGRALEKFPVLSLDMGGTTAKIAFLDRSGPSTRSMFEIDRRHFYKKGSGLPVLIPALDLVEIGAGGGSLAGKGPLGTLVVGPESAGAEPGPACYGRGSDRPTVTDADLVLGLLNPEYFLGGTMPLDLDSATRALEQHVAKPLDLDLLEAARGIHVLVGSNMAQAARVHAAERGLDVSTHTLVAFGGAGPVHAWGFARELRIPTIVYPAHAGVASALGFLAAGPAFEIARSRPEVLKDLNGSAIQELLEELVVQARALVESAGPGPVDIRIFADMRYQGQGAEVRVPLADRDINRQLLQDHFVRSYQDLYGKKVDGIPIEVVTWRVRCEKKPLAVGALDRAGDPSRRRKAPEPLMFRKAWMPDVDSPITVPVFRREALEPGMILKGPALIEETQCTLVLGRGQARVLPGGTIQAEVSP